MYQRFHEYGRNNICLSPGSPDDDFTTRVGLIENTVLGIYRLPSLPDPCGVLNGVVNAVLGVCDVCFLGTVPSKSLAMSGVFMPPFSGVSTLVSARMVRASCVILK